MWHCRTINCSRNRDCLSSRLPAVARVMLKAGSSAMRVNLVNLLWVLFMTSVSVACLLLRPVPHLSNLRLTKNASVQQTGSPLEHVLVGISFHFNCQKLVHLKYVSTLSPADLTPVVACICDLSGWHPYIAEGPRFSVPDVKLCANLERTRFSPRYACKRIASTSVLLAFRLHAQCV